MDLQHFPIRRAISELNPRLIESWCMKCGVFIAASNDIKKLRTAEGIHACSGDYPSNDSASPSDDGIHAAR